MNNRRNHYRILQVQPDAPAPVIKASYRALMQGAKMHPDLGGDHAQAVFINEAFAVLSDPVRRAEYDRSLARAAPRRAQPAPPGTTKSAPQTPLPQGPACAFCAAPCNATDLEQPDALCTKCGSALFAAARRHDGLEWRRATAHVRRNMPMTFRFSTSRTKLLAGTTRDLSLNGMQFLSRVELPLAERVSINCDFCTAVGIVKSVRPDSASQGRWRCGVEFLRLHLKHQRGGLFSSVA